jgi:hypothetical protein
MHHMAVETLRVPVASRARVVRVHGSSRLQVVGAGLIVIGWVAARLYTWSTKAPWQATLHFFGLLALGAACLVAFVASAMNVNSLHPGPSALVVRHGRAFVVPPNRAFGYFVAGEVFAAGWLLSLAMNFLSLHLGHGPRLVFVRFEVLAMATIAVALAAVVVGRVASTLRARPSIELNRDALVVRDPFGCRTIPWEALRPGLPAVPANAPSITLTLDRPELVERNGLTWGTTRASLSYAKVHPLFLADAIQFYVDNPDRRDGLGTRTEYLRLLDDLGVA